jgi:chemotaxis response regulator CheB
MRVLLFCNEYLLVSAITALLSKEKDLTLLNLAEDRTELARKIADFQPDVIITDDIYSTGEKLDFYELLRTHLGLKILVVRAEKNSINLFKCREVPVTRSDDLLYAIYSD